MSLFNEIKTDLIEKPTNTNYYHRILKQDNQKIKTDKEKRKEMREKLSKEEYIKRYKKQYYKREKARYKKRYKRDRWITEAMLEEICDELWPGNDTTDWDKYYTKKFKDDDVKRRAYRYSWRSSRLRRINRSRVPKQKLPFRIANRKQMDQLLRDNIDKQNWAYKYLKPYMGELNDCMLALNRNQLPYDYPVYVADEKHRNVVEKSPENIPSTYLVYDGMRRWKYMVSEMYLWRNSFILGDVVVTQTGNLFRISLENNFPWLTKDTVEEIHEKRMARIKGESDDAPPIYIVNDAYLIKIQPNERETLFYIVPT